MTKITRTASLLLFIFLILFMMIGCQTISQYYAPGGAEGTARYYAKRYNGRKTTSGEIYDSKRLKPLIPLAPLHT
jgi:uncharacterized protein YceK